jgi:hypothetical protein
MQPEDGALPRKYKARQLYCQIMLQQDKLYKIRVATALFIYLFIHLFIIYLYIYSFIYYLFIYLLLIYLLFIYLF